jgi:hypothetical protein
LGRQVLLCSRRGALLVPDLVCGCRLFHWHEVFQLPQKSA